jgi:PAS domain S-box-containing protein
MTPSESHNLESRVQELEKKINKIDHFEQELLNANNRVMAILDSLDAIVYVADMETYEILFINQYTRNLFGNIVGKICWQTLQDDKTGPCSFCSNNKIVDQNGNPTGMYLWERQKKNKRWYEMRDRAIIWENGKVVRLEIATDITERKKTDEEREKLIKDLQNALNEIKVLRGILPICSSCKKIRDDKGYWNLIESYIQSHSEAEFSHCICPDCKKLFHIDK